MFISISSFLDASMTFPFTDRGSPVSSLSTHVLCVYFRFMLLFFSYTGRQSGQSGPISFSQLKLDHSVRVAYQFRIKTTRFTCLGILPVFPPQSTLFLKFLGFFHVFMGFTFCYLSLPHGSAEGGALVDLQLLRFSCLPYLFFLRAPVRTFHRFN